MIQASDLILLFKQALSEQWGYIWNGVGQVWTAAKQKAATRETTVKYGSKWIGRRVADCSGLFAWAFKELGGYIYHGSNTIWRSYCTSSGTVGDGHVMRPGTAVFLREKTSSGGWSRHHIGLYIGDNTVIEAKGTRYGVVTSGLSHWDEWGELKGVVYGDVEGDGGMESVQFGSRGDAVKQLQAMLNQIGESLVVDGIFGAKTRDAVEAFQEEFDICMDGICGEATWSALTKAVADMVADNVDGNDTTNQAPTAQSVTRDEFDALVSRVIALEAIVYGDK